MYRPEQQQAIKDKYERGLMKRGARKRKHERARKKFAGAEPIISREELQQMHCAVAEIRRSGECGPGTQAYNLLAALGCCLGNWPRVRPRKAAELRERYRQLVRDSGPEVDSVANNHLAAIQRGA